MSGDWGGAWWDVSSSQRLDYESCATYLLYWPLPACPAANLFASHSGPFWIIIYTLSSLICIANQNYLFGQKKARNQTKSCKCKCECWSSITDWTVTFNKGWYLWFDSFWRSLPSMSMSTWHPLLHLCLIFSCSDTTLGATQSPCEGWRRRRPVTTCPSLSSPGPRACEGKQGSCDYQEVMTTLYYCVTSPLLLVPPDYRPDPNIISRAALQLAPVNTQ